MDFSAKWQAITDFELLWHVWQEDNVIYHAGSGDTHLLSEDAAKVLRSLQKEPANTFELENKLASSFDLPQDTKLSSYLEIIMTDLNKLGVIECNN